MTHLLFFRKLQFIFIGLVFPLLSIGQIGVGTASPDASAKLEIAATDKGFLPPRVSLTGSADVVTIPNPATGLLVYNQSTAGTQPNDVIPGYYYFNGTKWVTIGNNTIEGWSTTVASSPNITIGATTTAPTKSTTRTRDYVRFRKVGDKQYEVEYKYFVPTQTGSSAGSGDYLFTLPGGLRFNSIDHPFYTSPTRVADSWGFQLLSATVVVSHDGWWATGTVIPYDATRFRLALVSGGNTSGQFAFIGATNYAITAANVSYNIYFKFNAE